MISVIICSRTSTIGTALSENIKNSIGCEYELISIDNSKNTYSIFEAYNLGIQKSKFDFLCFIHDDVFIYKKNWGECILDIFNKDQRIGLIGVAGSKIKSKMPSPWWNCPENQKAINIVQHYNHKNREKMALGFGKSSNVEAMVIDGVFIAARKDDNIRFDTGMRGFHNYDLNISFEYKKWNYKIIITNQVGLEHYSTGSLNGDWVKSTYRIHRKYKNILPLKIAPNVIKKEIEIANAVSFLEECITYKKYGIGVLVWSELLILYPKWKWHIRLLYRLLKKNKQCWQ